MIEVFAACSKNVLQFVLETAHQQILYKVTSAHADILSWYCCDRKSAPTHETAPLFLYKHVIPATHSCIIWAQRPATIPNFPIKLCMGVGKKFGWTEREKLKKNEALLEGSFTT